MNFLKTDLLNYQEIETIITSVKPTEKGKIITNKLLNYILLNNNEFYKFDICNVLYNKEDFDEDNMLTIISSFIDESYTNLTTAEQQEIQNKHKKYFTIFSNSSIKSYYPQIKTYLTNKDVNFSDPHLNQIHFINGYYDFKTGTFTKRVKGKDYINVHIKREYKESSEKDIDRVLTDIKKIYPNEADRNYLLMQLGISLTGQSANDQTILFLLGSGSSGKSTIIELCKLSFQDYVYSLPKKTFSKGFSDINKVLNTYLKKPYIRISDINEPEDTKMDDSLFKDHCDGNIQTTKLYHDGSTDFKHFSKIIIKANTFPNIKIDSGSARRVESYTHTSKFVKNEDDVNKNKNYYLANPSFLTDVKDDTDYLNAFFNIISKYGYNWLHKKCIFKQTENFKDTKSAIISTNDIMQDFLDQYITITKDEKDRIGRDDMYSYFKSAYPKSIITSTQLLNSLKDREILYAPNHRINNLRGCYLCVKYKDINDEFDDEQKSNTSSNLKDLDKGINDEFDDELNDISQTKLTKKFKKHNNINTIIKFIKR